MFEKKVDPLKEDLERAKAFEKLQSDSEQQFDRDRELYGRTDAEQGVPSDFYQYKHMVIQPNTGERFDGLADKDTVLANYKKKLPDPAHHKLIVETCISLKHVFCVEREVPVLDHEGKPVYSERVVDGVRRRVLLTQQKMVFDENFRVVLDFLQGGHKFEEVASRAMGDTRASILDRSNLFGKHLKGGFGGDEQKGKKK
jgi:hypothetical protein